MLVCNVKSGHAKRNRKLQRKAKRKILSTLSKSELRRYRAVSAADKIFYVAVGCLFIAAMTGLCYIGANYTDNVEASFATCIVQICYMLGMLIVSCLITVVPLAVYQGIKNRKCGGLEEIERRIYEENEKLYYKETYGAEGDYKITKCFVAPEKSFEGQDVLVFFTEGKLLVISSCDDGKFIQAELKNCSVKVPDTQEYLQFGKSATVVSDGADTLVLGKRVFSFLRAAASV